MATRGSGPRASSCSLSRAVFEGSLVERGALEAALPPVDSRQHDVLDEETREALSLKYGTERV